MTGQGKSLPIQPHRRYSTPKAVHFIVEDAEIYFGICSSEASPQTDKILRGDMMR
jgi:hypothetical protein